MSGANLRCVDTILGTSFLTVHFTGSSFFTDISTLPEDFFRTVAAGADDGVDFVLVFVGNDSDAVDRMMTTVVELAGLLLLVVVVVARRPIFSDNA